MELNWSTFVLEIVNFLVLVWILRRFLYRPVVNALRRRQENIAEELERAASLKAESAGLKRQYESRLQDWELEKQQARESLQAEIGEEKARQLGQLQAELAEDRKNAAAVVERQRREERHRDLENAHRQGARFATKLLEAAAGPELESRLFELLIQALDSMSEDRRDDLRQRCAAAGGLITVTSAYPMPKAQLETLRQRLSANPASDTRLEHRLDPDLVAGFQIIIDALVLHLNLRDELEDYATLFHGKFDNAST